MTFSGNERFQIQRHLGTGGMGEVYEAFDCQARELVALKALFRSDHRSVERFKNEFFSLKDLNHKNLVKLKEFFEERGQLFFTMELVKGRDFLTSIKNINKRFDEEKLRKYLGQLASGIAVLHENGKVHRDLKPSNIIVTEDERVVILDFGLVTDVIAGIQLGDIAMAGTAAYMSPEQSVGLPVGAAVDWYSLGVLLYQSLTGRLPFEGSVYKMRTDRQLFEPLPPSAYSPEAPDDLTELCMELLRYDPKKRPRGRQVLERLGVDTSYTRDSLMNVGGAEIYQKTAPFVGRTKEIGILSAAFDHNRMGHDVSLVILGEAGLGKTALAGEFLKRVETRKDNQNVIILSGRCQKNTAIRFQAFNDIADSLIDEIDEILDERKCVSHESDRHNYKLHLSSDEAAAVVKVFPAFRRIYSLLDVEELWDEKKDPGRTRAHAFRAVRKMFRFLSSQRPLIFFIDDLQWARDDSLDMLKEVMQGDPGTSIFFVATMRSEETIGRSLDDILQNVRKLYLTSLTHEEIVKLTNSLSQLYGTTFSKEQQDAIAKESQGHPLFLTELVRHVIVWGDITVGKLEDVLWSRIEHLDQKVQHVLNVICLAGIALDHETIADAAELEIEDCSRSVSALLSQNLVRCSGQFENEKIEPYHDRVHETVVPHIPLNEKRKYHQKLAYAIGVDTKGVDQTIIVSHLEHAGLTGEAARIAENAAEVASNSLAFSQAVDLLQTALRLGDHGEKQRRKLFMELGDALCNIGRGTDASIVYLDARRGADYATRFELWRRAAEQLVLGGYFTEGLEELRLLLAEIGEGFPKTPTRTLLLLIFKRLILKIRGLHWKYRTAESIDSAVLAKLDVYQVVVENFSMVFIIMGAYYQAKRLLAALRYGDARRIGDAFTVESVHVSSQGTPRAFRRARQLIEMAKKMADEYSILNLKLMVKAVTGILAYFEGRLRASARLLYDAEEGWVGQGGGSVFQLNNSRIFRMRVLRLMGDFKGLRDSAEKYMREAARGGDKYLETNMRLLRCTTWLSQDMTLEAYRDLEKIHWSPPEEGFHLQHWYETIARAEIALYEGTVLRNVDYFSNTFEIIKKTLLLRVGTNRAEYYWLKGRVLLMLAAASSPSGAKKHLKAAARQAKKLTLKRTTGFRPAQIWAHLLLAAIEDQRGNRQGAISRLNKALKESDEIGCAQIAASARRRLGQMLGDNEGNKMVSESAEWMKRNGVVNPEAMTNVFLPGFVSVS